MRDILRSEAGFSLIEMMVTVSLLFVVLVPAFMYLGSHQRNENFVQKALQQQADARLGLERMSRATREATYPAGLDSTNSAMIANATDYDFSFYTEGGRTNGFAEKSRYYVDTATSTLKRDETICDTAATPCSYTSSGATKTTSTMVDGVRNVNPGTCGAAQPMFTYWTADTNSGSLTQITAPGTDITSLVKINYVKVTMVIDADPNKSPACQVVGTSVSLRNHRG